MAFPAVPSLGSLAGGLGAVLGRTFFILTNTPSGVPIPLVVLDVVKNEDPEYTADVTEHPVEKGPEVSDHIQLKNPTLRLQGKISNTPLDSSVAIANLLAGTIAAISSSQSRSNLLNTGLSTGVGIVGAALQGKSANALSNAVSGAQDAIARTILLAAYQNKVPFDVVTKRQRYQNMVIDKLRFPRTEDTGYALEFDMNLKQLTIVSPLTVQSSQLDEKVISSGTPSTSLGAQSTQQVSPQTQSAVQGSTLGGAPGVSSKSPGFFA